MARTTAQARRDALLEEYRRTGSVHLDPSRAARARAAAVCAVVALIWLAALAAVVLAVVRGTPGKVVEMACGAALFSLLLWLSARPVRLLRPRGPLSLTASREGLALGDWTLRWDEVDAVDAVDARRAQPPPLLTRIPITPPLSGRRRVLAVQVTEEGLARLRASRPGAARADLLGPDHRLQIPEVHGVPAAVLAEVLAVVRADAGRRRP